MRAGRTRRAGTWPVIVLAFAIENAIDGRESGERSDCCNYGGGKGRHGDVEGGGQALVAAMFM